MGRLMVSDYRAGAIEAMAEGIESTFDGPRANWSHEAEAALDALVEYLKPHATPIYARGGLSGAMYVDDEPDEDTTWVIDLAVLRGG